MSIFNPTYFLTYCDPDLSDRLYLNLSSSLASEISTKIFRSTPMMSAEPKRRSIPAVRDCILVLKNLSEQISSIDAEVRTCKDKIRAIMEEKLAKTEKSQLLKEFGALSNELQELRRNRKALYESLDSIKSRIDGIKDESMKAKGSSSLRTIEDVEKRMTSLEMRLITERISPNDEKIIAAEMQSLRGRMNQLSDLESNSKKQKTLDEQHRELKIQIAELSKTISEKVAEKESIKAELDKINEARGEKPSIVQQLESHIADLREKRQDLIKKKEEKREDIRKAEEEFAKLMEEATAQKELEEKKAAIRKNIASLKAEKEALFASVSLMDPANLDPLIYSLKALRLTKPFVVNVNLLDSLLKIGAGIPKDLYEVDKIIGDLTARRESGKSAFAERSEKTGEEVALLDEKIRAEEAKITELPPTDYEILRRAGYREFNLKSA